VFTAGFALIFLALLYWVIEIRGWRGRWTMPFLVFGKNAIIAFCFDELLWAPLYYGHAKAADGNSIPWQQYLNGQLLKIANPAKCLSAFCFRGGVVCLVFFMAVVPQAHLRKDLAHKGLGWTPCTWLKSNFARSISRRVSFHRSPPGGTVTLKFRLLAEYPMGGYLNRECMSITIPR
jgi:hypothetical protein